MLALLALAPGRALVAQGDNLILNGDFATNLDSWTTFAADFNGVSASFASTNGEAAITNIAGAVGANAVTWHVQLNQVLSAGQIAALQVGSTYTISFDARSSTAGRPIRLFFGQNSDSFTPLNSTNVNLTTEMTTYTAIFVVTSTFSQMKLGFEMGLSTADVFIDNVSMVLGGEVPATVNLPVTFEDTELDYKLDDFGGNASQIVTDPTDATNKVVRSIKTASAELWAGTTVGGTAGFSERIPFTASNTTMSLRVWSPHAGIKVRMKVESSTDATKSVETEATVTVAEGWETLVFDFSNQATGTAALNLAFNYNKASVFFNFGTTGAVAGERTYYWDDMSFGGESEPTAPATPVGFVAANTIGGTPVANGEVFLAVGPNDVSRDDIVYRLYYALTASAPADPTTATQYTFGSTAGDGGGDNAFGFVLGGLETATSYTFWLYQYNTELQLFSAPASATVVSGGGTTGGGGGLNPPVTFDDPSLTYVLEDFGGNASEIVTDPTNAQNKVVRSVKSAAAQLWAGTTVGASAGFANALPFTATETTMSVRVWSPHSGILVRLKVEDSTDPTKSVETEATMTVAEGWETLVFNFANQAPGTAAMNLAFRYNKASIFFNFGKTGAEAGERTYYWDDMIFGGVSEPTAPPAPVGFVAADNIGGNPVNPGEVFLAAGPNNVESANISYRLFYSLTASAPQDPKTATAYTFGSTAGDGGGEMAFGFVLGGLQEKTEYTFWLYQYDTAAGLYSDPAMATVTSGGETTTPTVPPNPVGFVVSDKIGDAPVATGQLFLAVGPNNVADANIVYRLFYSKTADAPQDPKTATAYTFGSTDGDGGGDNAFGFVLGGLDPGVNYTFWLFQYNTQSQTYSEQPAVGSANAGASTSVDGSDGFPTEIALEQNYPNPFNPGTVITFALPEAGRVRLDVFNTLGQQVATLADGVWSAGRHDVVFDASGMTSGLYLYRLQVGQTSITRSMMLVK